MKVARTVWDGGKVGDDLKDLPIAKSAYFERKNISQGWHTLTAGVYKTPAKCLSDICVNINLITLSNRGNMCIPKRTLLQERTE